MHMSGKVTLCDTLPLCFSPHTVSVFFAIEYNIFCIFVLFIGDFAI